jgi:hypothetical protein
MDGRSHSRQTTGAPGDYYTAGGAIVACMRLLWRFDFDTAPRAPAVALHRLYYRRLLAD